MRCVIRKILTIHNDVGLPTSEVLQTDTLPGISDHDIVYPEFDFRPVIHCQKPRSIPLYNISTEVS
jgi:hypothetical protein